MKSLAVFAITFAICTHGGGVPGRDASGGAALTVEALTRNRIDGKLGLPIGNLVRLQCCLVANPNNKLTDSDWPYRVKITHIDTRKLLQPIVMDFVVDDRSKSEIAIRPEPLQFAEDGVADTKTKPTYRLGSILAERWLGRTIQCLAYETGSFTGHPRHSRELAPRQMVASRGFHFQSHVVLIHPDRW